MKFFLDNNLSPALARALHELTYLASNKTHSVIALRDMFPANTQDTEWIQTLADEGGWVVISQDKFKKSMEPEVLRRAGLIVFLLGKSWKDQNFWSKAHQLVRWWPAIIEQTERLEGAAAFEVPLRFSGKGKFMQLKL
ncbi:MAG: hypothetical protein COW18_14035 [Zetaproteobacteria bacterium CG12_big_fil_rev_8_21_14_0_65_54_13]|nr:MAG: hypothetical protein COX55_03835 [Zetaproteobacteria bacterium CG23_combo_of_CG06-09_8_20_14_all_54_7]PIW44121.1 MAG: hypothetical protein COW18_14035 [Zetaproteobacteria bacterium CG12_big_fil_rev_8_21_14_0_65_54_13]PIX54522.1 MAG: hypothetical protein COZ50_07710 [Zetaproteobacteria bacterium CG_4_10_14_3_um_filter_54_28]PJA28696.1 MAG: hypothetical protein CO188_08740 [Zetaproteobacteria bacterium CG_4_9_14_3_um_filter_54_145]